MDRVWAPWRGEYLTKAGENNGEACVFCGLLEQKPSRENLVLYKSKNSFVVMNKYPYNNGHIMVVPKKHVDSLDQLSVEEYNDLAGLLKNSVAVVNRVFNPQGSNIGMNLGKAAGAGIADHVHFHIVPRWIGDTNFMPVFAEIKVISEHIFDSYDKMFKIFAEVMK